MPQEFKQFTIGDIIDSEREMFLTAGDRYGEYFAHVSALNTLLNNFIKSVDDPEKIFFMVYLSSVKKHHTLALLSTVRLHSVQAKVISQVVARRSITFLGVPVMTRQSLMPVPGKSISARRLKLRQRDGGRH